MSLRVFLRLQLGIEGFPQALEDVRRCSRLAMPWVLANYANNVIPNASSVPQLVPAVLEMIRETAPWGPGTFDPFNLGWSLLANNQPETAVDMWGLQWPNLLESGGWAGLVATAQARVSELAGLTETVRQQSGQALSNIDAAQKDITTKAGQVSLLIDSLSDRTANALYTEDAERRGKEGKAAWRLGLAVLVTAAFVALWPLLAHYAGRGPAYTTNTLLAAHVGPTIALGALAGVLLARARNRDHASQRSADLATAMGTMIVYSEKIEDPAARQLFMQNMGRLILEAHLRAEASPTTGAPRDDLNGLVALANALRPSGPSPS